MRFTLVFLLASGLARAQGDPDELDSLRREERVRRLEERTWEMTAARVEGQIVIDGSLDERAWSLAEPVTDFYQRESKEGLPATEPTEVRVLYDETNLYVGFRCYDSDPDRTRARTLFRDESLASDDAVAVMLDAYNDHRS